MAKKKQEEETDSELVELLGSMEGGDPLPPASTTTTIPDPVVKEPPGVAQQEQIPKVEIPNDLPIKVEVQIIEPQTTPNDKEKNQQSSSLTVQTSPPPEEDLKDSLRQLIRTFPKAAQRIIDNHASDRTQVDKAIDYYETQIREARETNSKLPPAFIEGYVKLLGIKADINANANGVLDSTAKLLAAAKNHNIIVNVGDTGEHIDLAAMLSQPRRPDETMSRGVL